MKISLEKILIGILIGILLFCVGKKMFMVEGATNDITCTPNNCDNTCTTEEQCTCDEKCENGGLGCNLKGITNCRACGDHPNLSYPSCQSSTPPPSPPAPAPPSPPAPPNRPPAPPNRPPAPPNRPPVPPNRPPAPPNRPPAPPNRPPAPPPYHPPSPPSPPSPPAPPSTNPCDNLAYGSCTAPLYGSTGYCVNIQKDPNIGKYFCNDTILNEFDCNKLVQAGAPFTWCPVKQAPGPPSGVPTPSAPQTNPCNIADKIGKTYFKWNDGKIPGCRNDQCIRTDEQIKQNPKLSKRVCGPTNVWTDGVTCADYCDASLENLDMMNLCVLTENCKKNPCEINLIDADTMDQGKLVFYNHTDASIYVVIDKTTKGYDNSTKPPRTRPSSFDKYHFYKVDQNKSITFGFTTWESGKAFIIPYLTKTIEGGTFNGNGLGGLEWTVKNSDGRGFIASGNLSAVDGINFNSKMKFYNVKCGDYNNRETNLEITDRNLSKFRGLQNDRIPTYKSPLGRFVNDNCSKAEIDKCSGTWKKSDECYFENIKNKWNCLDLMAKAEFNLSNDPLSNDIRDWVKFVSSESNTNIYAWAYDEIQIQDPKKGPPECGGMPCRLPTNQAGWKESKHLKCISDELCGDECYGYVGNNVNRRPLIVCAEPSASIPSIVFEITEILR
jgi:hypothetical protein